MYTSLHDNKICRDIEKVPGVSFYGIFMALIKRADTDNLIRLERAFPEVVKETRIRYYAPGGALNLKEWQEHFPEESKDMPQELMIKLFHDAQIKGSKGT